jgi:hypothetical protein
LEDVPGELADALCSVLYRCSPFIKALVTEENCQETFESSILNGRWNDIESAVDEGRAIYDGVKMGECLAEQAAASCDATNADPESCQEAEEHRDGDVLAAEKDEYGYDHSEIGALVARRWGLQEEVCYAIRHHHSSTGAERAAIVSQVVESADMLANLKGYGLRRVEPETLSTMESLHLLNIDTEDLETVWAMVSDEIEEAVRGYE